MGKLIGNGHLYIAQPPLYKVSKGRSAKWLYSDSELDEWMADKVYGTMEISNKDNSLVIKGKSIGKLLTPLRDFIDSREAIKILGIPDKVLNILLENNEFKNLDFSPEIIIEEENSDEQQRSLFDEENEENIVPEPKYKEKIYEIEGFNLTQQIYENPTLQRVLSLYPKVSNIIKENSFILKKNDDIISDKLLWNDLPGKLEANSDKSGVNVQRYKGLGEMNPEQLWDTTMDPENRVMLRVTAEDAMEADEVFRTLMGDEVAPRRDFIRANALEVKNLDV